MMSLRPFLKVFAILIAFLMAAFFIGELTYATAYGASGCIRLSEDTAIFSVLAVMVSLGVALAGIASFIPSLKGYIWRIALGSLAACLMFGLGLLLA
jgi:hypothetical protein